MATMDAVEGLEAVAVVGGIALAAYFAYKLLMGFGNSQTGAATDSLVSGLVQIPATGINTIVGAGGAAGVPGTDSNLFYGGLDNLFTTGSIYGDQGGNGIQTAPTPTPSVPWYAYIPI